MEAGIEAWAREGGVMKSEDTFEKDPFETATWYSCDDQAERLSADDPVTALQEHDHAPGEPVTVFAYGPCEPSEADIERTTKRMIETLVDDIRGEWGEPHAEGLADPDGGDDGFDREATEAMAAVLAPLVRHFFDQYAEVWACRVVAERVYSAEDVAMLCSAEPWEEEARPA